MKRCPKLLAPPSTPWLALLGLVLTSTLAQAQNIGFSASSATSTTTVSEVAAETPPTVRKFPPNAVRGEMLVLAPPDVTIDGKADRLSPAVRIRNAGNYLVLSGTLSGQKLLVNYVRDNTGLVQQAWVLTPEEIKQKLPGDNSGGILSNIRSMFDTKAAVDDGKTPYDQLPSYKP